MQGTFGLDVSTQTLITFGTCFFSCCVSGWIVFPGREEPHRSAPPTLLPCHTLYLRRAFLFVPKRCWDSSGWTGPGTSFRSPSSREGKRRGWYSRLCPWLARTSSCSTSLPTICERKKYYIHRRPRFCSLTHRPPHTLRTRPTEASTRPKIPTSYEYYLRVWLASRAIDRQG